MFVLALLFAARAANALASRHWVPPFGLALVGNRGTDRTELRRHLPCQMQTNRRLMISMVLAPFRVDRNGGKNYPGSGSKGAKEGPLMDDL